MKTTKTVEEIILEELCKSKKQYKKQIILSNIFYCASLILLTTFCILTIIQPSSIDLCK